MLDRWPETAEIRLPLSPVSAIVAARVYDTAGAAQIVPADVLALDRHADLPLIRVVGPVPAAGRERSAIEIDVTPGYGATAAAVPALL